MEVTRVRSSVLGTRVTTMVRRIVICAVWLLLVLDRVRRFTMLLLLVCSGRTIIRSVMVERDLLHVTLVSATFFVIISVLRSDAFVIAFIVTAFSVKVKEDGYDEENNEDHAGNDTDDGTRAQTRFRLLVVTAILV